MRKMKSYANFDDYLEDQGSRNQEIIRALRKLVQRVEPGLSETVKWGNGCWTNGARPVAYVYSDKQCVQFAASIGTCYADVTARTVNSCCSSFDDPRER